MSRTKIALALCTVMLCVLALHEAVHSPAAIAEAQEPITTPEPIQPIGPVETFTNTPEPTIAATATPEPTQPSAALGEALPVLINARLDLDVLANDRLGGQRPAGWNGSADFNDAQIPLLIRLDLELLAGTTMGADQRPAGWFGAVASSTYAIARDIRHDLELLADTIVGAGIRPNGWTGDDPIMRCNRATQALVGLLERSFRGSGGFELQIDPNSPQFCTQAEIEASRYTEVNLLSNNTGASGGLNAPAAASGTVTPIGNFTVAFLDRDAQQRIGIIPRGTALTVVARSYTTYSAMILVQAAGFQVFVDYTTTTLTEDQFEPLPNVDGVDFDTFCDADWCSAG
ncbi:MAG: hypothetical protein U0694_25335 [Anaerolineae bacterium]